MATFLGNEKIYYRERYNGPTTPVKIVFHLKDKKNAGYLKTFYLGPR